MSTVVMYDRSSPMLKGLFSLWSDEDWSDSMCSDELISVVLVWEVLLIDVRLGTLSEDSFDTALELEFRLQLHVMGACGLSASELHSLRMGGGVDSDLLFTEVACFGIFIWVMANVRYSALACISCWAVMVCGSLLLVLDLISERKRSMFTWSSSAWEISSSCLSM